MTNPDIIFIGRLAATALVINVAWRVTKATKRALDKRLAESFIYAGPWQNDPLGHAPQRLLAFMLMTVLAALFGAIWL